MLAEQAIRLDQNPIDTVEMIFKSKSYAFERRSENDIVVEVEGKWDNMLLFVAWEENMRCLHISCLMNLKAENADCHQLFELMAMVNENLWLGHFSYWSAHKMPIFKHAAIIDKEDEGFVQKLEQMIEIAVYECERLYPIFDAVLTQHITPQQALFSERLFMQ